jgi:hypothetical protein
MGEHQIGGKGGWGTNQSSGQPPIKRLPNEMPIPSMASIIATLSPGQFPLTRHRGSLAYAVSGRQTLGSGASKGGSPT